MKAITLKEKILLIFCGLVAAFAIAEIGLRLGGLVYYSYRIKKNAQLNDENTVKILCLGDSFTFGTGAKRDYTYPQHLQRIFNERALDKKIVVYNSGIPGQNSSQLLKNLENDLNRYDPNIVVLLTGLNDRWSLVESNYFLFMDNGIRTRLYRLDAFLSRMRTWKLLKMAIASSKIKLSMALNIEHEKNIDKELEENRKNLDQALIKKMEVHLMLGEKYLSESRMSLAEQEYKKAIEACPYDARAYYKAGFFYYLYEKYDVSIRMLQKALKIDPYNIEARNELWRVYYRIGKNQLAMEQLHKLNQIQNGPDEDYAQVLKFGLPRYNDRIVFENLFKYNLKNIIALARSKGNAVVLQTYPDSGFNDVIAEIAKVYDIPLVDNERIFTELSSTNTHKRYDYFAEDGHLNDLGYRIMAESIYGVLLAKKEEFP